MARDRPGLRWAARLGPLSAIARGGAEPNTHKLGPLSAKARGGADCDTAARNRAKLRPGFTFVESERGRSVGFTVTVGVSERDIPVSITIDVYIPARDAPIRTGHQCAVGQAVAITVEYTIRSAVTVDVDRCTRVGVLNPVETEPPRGPTLDGTATH